MRRLAFLAISLALAGAFVLGSLELLLRLAPGLLRPGLGNHVYSKYGTFPGAIYFTEPSTRMRFMRRNFETVAYWNGYRWTHRTDARGFRNPPGQDSSVLLLGDSLIYGHGVEREETSAYFLESEFGVPVYNMARQGDALYQHYILLRLYLETLRPERILLFVFRNDPLDLLIQRKPEEIAEAPELARDDYGELHPILEAIDADPPVHRAHRWYRSLVWRAFKGLKGQAKRARSPRRRLNVPRGHRVELVVNYYRRILGDLAARTRESGADLSLIYLDLDTPLRARSAKMERRFEAEIAAIAGEIDLRFLTTGGLWAECEGCFLPNDGHLAAEGHRRLARFLWERILAPPTGAPLLTSPRSNE